MPAAHKVGHDQFETLAATLPAHGSGHGMAMACTAAERTFWGQFLGSGRGGSVCLAMKVLFKNLEKLSGQAGDNAKEQLELHDFGED